MLTYRSEKRGRLTLRAALPQLLRLTDAYEPSVCNYPAGPIALYVVWIRRKYVGRVLLYSRTRYAGSATINLTAVVYAVSHRDSKSDSDSAVIMPVTQTAQTTQAMSQPMPMDTILCL